MILTHLLNGAIVFTATSGLFSIMTILLCQSMWKILYVDGDVEVLRLDKERWELVGKDRKPTKVLDFQKCSFFL